jgi:hypothetical protein
MVSFIEGTIDSEASQVDPLASVASIVAGVVINIRLCRYHNGHVVTNHH